MYPALLEDYITPGAHLPPTQRRILRLLISHEGRNLTVKEVVDHIYSDDEDGGPLYAESVVSTLVYSIRRKLLPDYKITCCSFYSFRNIVKVR